MAVVRYIIYLHIFRYPVVITFSLRHYCPPVPLRTPLPHCPTSYPTAPLSHCLTDQLPHFFTMPIPHDIIDMSSYCPIATMSHRPTCCSVPLPHCLCSWSH